MSSIAGKLRAFAKGRETAYRIHQRLTGEKSRAISRIIQYCEYNLKAKDLRWIKSIKSDLLLILPGADSPLQKKRTEILEILNNHS